MYRAPSLHSVGDAGGRVGGVGGDGGLLIHGPQRAKLCREAPRKRAQSRDVCCSSKHSSPQPTPSRRPFPPPSSCACRTYSRVTHRTHMSHTHNTHTAQRAVINSRHPLLARHLALLLALQLHHVAACVDHLRQHDKLHFLLVGVLHPFGVTLEVQPAHV